MKPEGEQLYAIQDPTGFIVLTCISDAPQNCIDCFMETERILTAVYGSWEGFQAKGYKVIPAELTASEMPELRIQIIKELYKALEGLGAPMELLANVGSWGDTLTEEEVLSCLQHYNQSKSHGIQTKR